MFDIEFEVYTNISNFAIEGVLMQERRFIAFKSKNLSGSQLRRLTHEKELFAVVHYFKIWRNYLGSRKSKMYIDYISLKYFTSKV